MIRYITVSIGSGLLLGIMDALINANPLAEKLYAVYKPIARTTLNMPAATLIDVAFGFALAAIFLLLFKSLPGKSGLAKGFSFAVLVWFSRVVMYTASHWVMFNVPETALFYMLLTGLCEMSILGLLYGLTLKPS